MAYVANTDGFSVGQKVITTKKFESCGGYFEVGSLVMIIGVGPRGYDIADDAGNKILECGFTGFKSCN